MVMSYYAQILMMGVIQIRILMAFSLVFPVAVRVLLLHVCLILISGASWKTKESWTLQSMDSLGI